jgi:hypothetical protein
MALSGPVIASPTVDGRDRTGPGTGGPVVLPGQGFAPPGATIEVPGLRMELVPLGPVDAPEQGAPAPDRTMRDHGSRPLDAVLRTPRAAETGRPLPRVTATAPSVSEHPAAARPNSAATWLTSDGALPAADRLCCTTVLAPTHRRLSPGQRADPPGGRRRVRHCRPVDRIRRRG